MTGDTCIVMVVHDPQDRYATTGLIDDALAHLDRLHGEFAIVFSVNRPEDTPQTVAALRAWCVLRPRAHLQLNPGNSAVARGFNLAVQPRLADFRAFVFMSADALLVDQAVLVSCLAALDRWPQVGTVHPVSIFEDFEDANFSPSWSNAVFLRLLHEAGTAPNRSLGWADDPQSPVARKALAKCTGRRMGISRPQSALPLTFWCTRADLLREIGLLDERWDYGYECMDFALRAYRAGRTSVIVRNAFVFHRRLRFRLAGSYDTTSPGGDSSSRGQQLWLAKWGAPPAAAFDLERGVGQTGSAWREAARRLQYRVPGGHRIGRLYRMHLRR